VLLLILLVVVEPAGAAFPGKNGKIVFASRHSPGGFDGSNDYEIYTVNSNGTGEPDRLTKNTWNDREPAWSPDTPPLPGGNRIAFTSNRAGDYEIYTMNTNGSGVVRLNNGNGVVGQEPDWHLSGSPLCSPRSADHNHERGRVLKRFVMGLRTMKFLVVLSWVV